MKLLRVGFVLGLAFAMFLALSQLASAAPTTGYDIMFDGYCDGMHLEHPSLGLGTSATIDGHHTGCVSGGVFGTTSQNPAASHITTNYGGCCLYEYFVKANGTWTLYAESGNEIFQQNSGTWSFGTPVGVGPASASVHHIVRPDAGPIYNISFDGYCDGLHLVYPSAGEGTTVTVDGYHTGCISGGLFGTASQVSEAAHITTNYGGCCLYHFLVNVDRTWTIYAINGDLIFVINAGTWSPGLPNGTGPAAAG
jgi:hypothetical protein